MSPANKDENDELKLSLEQGAAFRAFNRSYNEEGAAKADAIQESCREGMTTRRRNAEAAGAPANNLTQLEDQFSRALADYNKSYKVFMEQVVARAKTEKDLGQYFDSNVTAGDGNYTYVNDYGFTHRYSTDAWTNKNVSCPQDSKDIEASVLDKLAASAPMGTGQPCGVAGKNIRDADSGEVAWVDIKGLKHVYSKEAWEQKSAGCNVSPIDLPSRLYDAIPSGPNMQPSDNCTALDVDPKAWAELSEKGEKLQELGVQLAIMLERSIQEDAGLRVELEKQRAQMRKELKQVSADQARVAKFHPTTETIRGELSNSRLIADSNRMHLLVWMLMAVLVISLVVHVSFAGFGKSTVGIAVLIAAIALLYLMVRG